MKKNYSITGLMIQDHERLTELFNDFKHTKNKNPKKARELFTKFDQELRKHFLVEEKVINLAFDKQRNKEIVNPLPIADTLISEHHRIKNILGNISKSIRNNNAVIDSSELYMILRHHKHVEERLFYPELDEMLSEKEKSYIVEKIKNKTIQR